MVKLIENGKYTAAVVYGKNLDAVDVKAVSEYCLFMRKCTNSNQPAFEKIPSGCSYYVFIGGDNEYAKAFGVTVPREKFEDDTVYILVKDDYVVLDGGIRGKLYAVYEFLERFFGVRFYGLREQKTPNCKNLSLEEQEILYTPPFAYRETYAWEVRWDTDFALRLRSNSAEYALKLGNAGGGLRWATPSSHTSFRLLMPPEDEQTGFAKHPEYYSFVKAQNKRVGRHHYEFGSLWGEGDICWSNPEVVDIVTERLKTWIVDQEDKDIFSVSQNDWPEYCECPECEEKARKYARDGESRPNAAFLIALNEIARRIKAWQATDERVKNRKIVLSTFAYMYSMTPPCGIELEDNIMIRFCTHENCFYHKFRDKSCPVNAYYGEALEEWKKIAKSVYVWDYTANHSYEVSFNTSLRHLQDNIQYFAENNAVGVFEEFLDFRKTGTWPEVRQYMIARLLWNPYIDYETEWKEAMEFFYEEGAPYLMEIEKRYYANTDAIADFHPRFTRAIRAEEYPTDFLSVATELFEKALAAVKREETKLRIRRDYVCLKFTKMYLNRENDLEEMKRVIEEMDALDVPFSKMELLKDHYFRGKQSDWFLRSIEERNEKRNRETIEHYKEILKNRKKP